MTFLTQYPATCETCSRDILVGTEAGYQGEGLVHVPSCPPPPKICPTCFLELPTTGVCDGCS